MSGSILICAAISRHLSEDGYSRFRFSVSFLVVWTITLSGTKSAKLGGPRSSPAISTLCATDPGFSNRLLREIVFRNALNCIKPIAKSTIAVMLINGWESGRDPRIAYSNNAKVKHTATRNALIMVGIFVFSPGKRVVPAGFDASKRKTPHFRQ